MRLKNKITGEIQEFSDEFGIQFYEIPEPNKPTVGRSYPSIKKLTEEWEDA